MRYSNVPNICICYVMSGNRKFVGENLVTHDQGERTLNDCIKRCEAIHGCLGITWKHGADYLAPHVPHTCKAYTGYVDGLVPLEDDESMCIRPCPGNYETQSGLVGNAGVDHVHFGWKCRERTRDGYARAELVPGNNFGMRHFFDGKKICAYVCVCRT